MPECFPGVDKGGDFMRDEQVIMENAVVTAEAVISIAVQKSLYSIERSKVLVCLLYTSILHLSQSLVVE